ncbi:MAG: hypothetical protein GX913_02050 [Clostridiales bacterium]|nr:hypothetical protein [Clostridiales bacterium]
MFVIGQARGKILNRKLVLPKEYHLKKKNILGIWKDKKTLYLSDSAKSLRFVSGDDTLAFNVYVDSEDRIDLPSIYENSIAEINGCITTIEISIVDNYSY